MKPFISIDIQGEKQLAAGFVRVQRGISNFIQPLTESTSLLRRVIDDNFDSEGSTLGRPWKKLANPRSGKILQLTGNMRRSFIDKVSTSKAEISNKTNYFKFHQSNKARTKLPRRIMMRIDATRRNEIMRIFTKFLNKVAKRF